MEGRREKEVEGRREKGGGGEEGEGKEVDEN